MILNFSVLGSFTSSKLHRFNNPNKIGILFVANNHYLLLLGGLVFSANHASLLVSLNFLGYTPYFRFSLCFPSHVIGESLLKMEIPVNRPISLGFSRGLALHVLAFFVVALVPIVVLVHGIYECLRYRVR